MKDHHFLIIAILILIMSAIIYYSGGGITSYAVAETNIVGVYQKDATTITITIDSSEDGVNRYATFLKGVSQVGSTKLCSSNRCVQPNTVEFYIPENWGDGSYSLRFYDYGTSSYQEVNFNIGGKNE